MQELRSRFLMGLEADLGQTQVLGARRIVPVVSGRVTGPRIRGKLLPPGGDWLVERPSGCYALDIRATIETDDGQYIYAHYLGRMRFPAHLQAAGWEERTRSDPSEYYFRTAPFFETEAPRYDWLNNIVAVGVGWLTPQGVAYNIHEIL